MKSRGLSLSMKPYLRFSLLLLVFVGGTVLSMQLFERMLLKQVQTVTEAANVAFTRLFVNEAWEELRPKLDMEVKQHPRFNPALSDVDMRVRRFAKGTDLIKVKIYNMQGVTVYSSDPTQLGEGKSQNKGFMEAVRGRVASETNYRGKFGAFDGELYDRNLVSSYVPVRGFQGIEAVVEVYADRTTSIDGVQAAMNKVWLYFGSGMAGAFVLVWALCQMNRTARTHASKDAWSNEDNASIRSPGLPSADVMADAVARLESQRSEVSALFPTSSQMAPDADQWKTLDGAVRSMLQTIDELALIHGIQHRQPTSNHQRTSVGEPIQRMLQDCAQRWTGKGIELQANVAPQLEHHSALGAASVARVLELLLEDAARRIAHGQIRFSAQMESPRNLQVEIIGTRDPATPVPAQAQQPHSLSLQAARSLAQSLDVDITQCSFGERGPWFTVSVPLQP